MYQIIKRNFDRGLWNIAMVKTACDKEVITATEYKNITGLDYGAPSASEIMAAAEQGLIEGVNSLD